MKKLKPYEIDFDRTMAKLAACRRRLRRCDSNNPAIIDLLDATMNVIHAYSEYINIRDTREQPSDDCEFIITIRKKEN